MKSGHNTEWVGLDERYRDFRDRTMPVFAAYPQLEPIRHTVFKELLVSRRAAGAAERVKFWLRPLRQRERTAGPLSQADVLLCPETRREVVNDALLPVYRALKTRGVRVKLLAINGPAGLPPEDTITFQFPARTKTPRWAHEAWEQLCQALPALREHGLRAAFEQEAARVDSLLDEMTRVLEAVRPRVLVTASTNLPGGAGAVMAGRRAGVETVLLQHGIPQAFYVPLLADSTLCWGMSSFETLRRLNADGTLLALGSPRHDAMNPGPPGAARVALQRALDLPERPTIVFFSNGNDLMRNGNAPRECAAWLERAAREWEGRLNFVVRLHPNEDGALYEGMKNLRLSKNEVDLATTLDGCDVAASLCSTVLYDALLFRKPVWQFYADHWPELADNWRRDLAVRIATAESLCEAAGVLEQGEGAGQPSESLIEYVFAHHGRAVDAIADHLAGRAQSLAKNG